MRLATNYERLVRVSKGTVLLTEERLCIWKAGKFFKNVAKTAVCGLSLVVCTSELSQQSTSYSLIVTGETKDVRRGKI